SKLAGQWISIAPSAGLVAGNPLTGLEGYVPNRVEQGSAPIFLDLEDRGGAAGPATANAQRRVVGEIREIEDLHRVAGRPVDRLAGGRAAVPARAAAVLEQA